MCALLAALVVGGLSAPLAQAAAAPAPASGRILHQMIAERLGGTTRSSSSARTQRTTSPVAGGGRPRAPVGTRRLGYRARSPKRLDAATSGRLSDQLHYATAGWENSSGPESDSTAPPPASREIAASARQLARSPQANLKLLARPTHIKNSANRSPWARRLLPTPSTRIGIRQHTKNSAVNQPQKVKVNFPQPKTRYNGGSSRRLNTMNSALQTRHGFSRCTVVRRTECAVSSTAAVTAAPHQSAHTRTQASLTSPAVGLERASSNTMFAINQPTEHVTHLLSGSDIDYDAAASDSDMVLAYRLSLANLDGREDVVPVFATPGVGGPHRRRVTLTGGSRWPNSPVLTYQQIRASRPRARGNKSLRKSYHRIDQSGIRETRRSWTGPGKLPGDRSGPNIHQPVPSPGHRLEDQALSEQQPEGEEAAEPRLDPSVDKHGSAAMAEARADVTHSSTITQGVAPAQQSVSGPPDATETPRQQTIPAAQTSAQKSYTHSIISASPSNSDELEGQRVPVETTGGGAASVAHSVSHAASAPKQQRAVGQETVAAMILHEETLRGGLIVGEYGELHGGGTVKRGVKYTADSSVDRQLLAAALQRFLRL